MKPYILDSDVLIGAFSDYYRMRQFPGVWEWFVLAAEAGRIVSIDRVRTELEDPEIPKWADDALPDGFFRVPSQEVLDEHRSIADWINGNPQYTAEAKAEFLGVADSFLIAHAKVGGNTIVIHEASAPHSKASIKIPDVGARFGVATLSLWDLLQHLKARFTLDAKSVAGLAASGG